MDHQKHIDIIKPGSFVVGCNYWASHAGTRMWVDWEPDTVAQDFSELSRNGLQVLRVFPLWPDFQPIHLLRAGAGQPHEVRFGECPLPDDDTGRAGVSGEMIRRFEHLANAAHQRQLKLMIGLITGWMSGRLYTPPALEGLNVLTDPFAIQWETRFVRYFVRHFKNYPAVLAWDLGNECNCMANLASREEAWAWTSAITNAIRSEDSSRPIVSGMHSLLPARNAHWTMQDQGELTDLLTTHPYPYFTPHCDQDPINTIRTILHSTAESRFYADIGRKPCIAEELGTLGPVLASESIAADFVRTCLFSLWANDCHGLLWWCAYDQGQLTHAPYDWNACERELGLIRADRSAKPVLVEIDRFRKFLDLFPYPELPPAQKRAVCILSNDQDQWGAAFSSYILAKQAGFDIEFQFSEQPLRPANLYLLPSVGGQAAIPRRRWLDLLKRVEQGAILYVSHHDGLLSPFNQPLGIEPQTRSRLATETKFEINGIGHFHLNAPVRLELKPQGANVIGLDNSGNPVFTENHFGSGRIYFFSMLLEIILANSPGAFHENDTQPFWKIYRHIATDLIDLRALYTTNPMIGQTEHDIDQNTKIVVLVNYSPVTQTECVRPAVNWKISRIIYGEEHMNKDLNEEASIPANDALVLELKRE